MEREIELLEEFKEPLIMASSNDPFYVVKDEIQAKLEYAKVKHARFQDLLENTNTATNNEFREIRKALLKEVSKAERDLSSLNMTIQAVENNREQFSHIDDNELLDRKGFVRETQQILKRITDDIKSDKVRKKMERDERQRLAAAEGGETGLGARTGLEARNTDFVLDSRARTKVTLRQQEEDLEEIGGAVDRVGQMAGTIHQELEDQRVMLNNFETEMDETALKMNTVMGHLSKLLKTKDRCQLGTILTLTVILVVLTVLVIYS